MCLVKCKYPLSSITPIVDLLDYPVKCPNIEEHSEEYEGNHGRTRIDYWITCKLQKGKRYYQACGKVEQHFCPLLRTENKERKDKILSILGSIAVDMRDDAVRFDGQPFNGKTVATYMGCQGAAIAALANIVKTILENVEEVTSEKKF